MQDNRRNHHRGFLVFGIMALILMLGLQPLAAQETAEATATSAPSAVEEDKPTASFGVDFLTSYVWRGFALSRNSLVIQPSMTVGYKGFFVNIWGNFDTDEKCPYIQRSGAKWNETDFTFGYSRDVYKGEIVKTLTINVGGIYYSYDGTLYPQGDSFELYYGLAADFDWFKLSVMGNSEVSHYPGTWLTVGLSRVFKLPYYESTLELGNNYIFLFSRDNVSFPHGPFSDAGSTKAFSGPLAGQLYATLNIPVHQYITVSPKVGFWYGLGGNSTELLRFGSWDSKHNHVYGGLNLTFSF